MPHENKAQSDLYSIPRSSEPHGCLHVVEKLCCVGVVDVGSGLVLITSSPGEQEHIDCRFALGQVE